MFGIVSVAEIQVLQLSWSKKNILIELEFKRNSLTDSRILAKDRKTALQQQVQVSQCEMKTATCGTDKGQSRVKELAVQPKTARDGNRKVTSSILRFLCPPTLPLGRRTQSLAIVRRSITLHAGTSCEEFTWLRSKIMISWNI